MLTSVAALAVEAELAASSRALGRITTSTGPVWPSAALARSCRGQTEQIDTYVPTFVSTK
jgi:hypothetical protein